MSLRAIAGVVLALDCFLAAVFGKGTDAAMAEQIDEPLPLSASGRRLTLEGAACRIESPHPRLLQRNNYNQDRIRVLLREAMRFSRCQNRPPVVPHTAVRLYVENVADGVLRVPWAVDVISKADVLTVTAAGDLTDK